MFGESVSIRMTSALELIFSDRPAEDTFFGGPLVESLRSLNGGIVLRYF